MVIADGLRREGRLSLVARSRLVWEIAGAYLTVRRVTVRHPLPRTVEILRQASGDASLLRSPALEGPRLGRAVVRTLRPFPRGSKCLTQSLVMLLLLARRGASATLVIAVHPGEQMLDAHAWVELHDQPLLPPGTHHERLLVL